MTVTVTAPHRCPNCEHSGALCAELVISVRRASALAIEKAAQTHVTLVPLSITVECPCYWRRGRGHG